MGAQVAVVADGGKKPAVKRRQRVRSSTDIVKRYPLAEPWTAATFKDLAYSLGVDKVPDSAEAKREGDLLVVTY